MTQTMPCPIWCGTPHPGNATSETHEQILFSTKVADANRLNGAAAVEVEVSLREWTNHENHADSEPAAVILRLRALDDGDGLDVRLDGHDTAQIVRALAWAAELVAR